MALIEHKIACYVRWISIVDLFLMYETKIRKSYLGFIEPRKQVLDGFKLYYCNMRFEMFLRMGKSKIVRSEEEEHRAVPSNITKFVLYEGYVNLFYFLRQAAFTFLTGPLLDTKLTERVFNTYRKKDYVVLKSSKAKVGLLRVLYYN